MLYVLELSGALQWRNVTALTLEREWNNVGKLRCVASQPGPDSLLSCHGSPALILTKYPVRTR